MPYVIVKSEHIDGLNRGIMRLLRPSHLREENWTDFYCGKVTHPTTGETALDLPESETVPIHVEANGQELAAILEIFVADGAITQGEADMIGGAVAASAGQNVRIADFIPPSWAANVKTREELEADGWFPEETL